LALVKPLRQRQASGVRAVLHGCLSVGACVDESTFHCTASSVLRLLSNGCGAPAGRPPVMIESSGCYGNDSFNSDGDYQSTRRTSRAPTMRTARRHCARHSAAAVLRGCFDPRDVALRETSEGTTHFNCSSDIAPKHGFGSRRFSLVFVFIGCS